MQVMTITPESFEDSIVPGSKPVAEFMCGYGYIFEGKHGGHVVQFTSDRETSRLNWWHIAPIWEKHDVRVVCFDPSASTAATWTHKC